MITRLAVAAVTPAAARPAAFAPPGMPNADMTAVEEQYVHRKVA